MWVIVANTDLETINDFKKRHHISLCFLTNNIEQFARILNPYFVPRVFTYDRGGRLAFIQPPSLSTDAAMSRAARVLEQSRRRTSR